MDKIAQGLVRYVINKGVITEEERAEYVYGFTTALEMCLSLVVSFLIAYKLHTIIEGIFFFVIFIPLRSYAGGLHLDQYYKCLALSSLTFLTVMLISKMFTGNMAYELIAFLILELIIYALYPVENVNRAVDLKENAYFKKKLEKYLLIDFVLVVTLFLLEKERYLVSITATLLLVAITMIIGKIKNKNLKFRCM